MDQNPIEIEFEGKLYQFQYFHCPPQDQEQENIKLIFQQSDIQQIGYITFEHIQAHFQNLQQFYYQLEKERLDQRYNFRLVRDQQTDIIWFNYYVNFQLGIHNLEVNFYVQLQQLVKEIDDKQSDQLKEFFNQLYEIQSIQEKNIDIVSKQQQQYQHLQQSAEKHNQYIEKIEQFEQYENKITVMENQLNQMKTITEQAKPIIEDLEKIYSRNIKLEDLLKVHLQNQQAFESINKQVELKVQNGFAISQAFSFRQKLKFKIEDSYKNYTFGIVPSNEEYESVNQIMNKDQAQYFFVPECDYKHGQKVYNNHLKHVFGNFDTIILIVDPSDHQIRVKVNGMSITTIRNKNMAQSYKFFISVKDQQDLEGLLLL